MKIELNGKAILALLALSGSLTFGNYVSTMGQGVIDNTPEYTVGSVVFRMDAENPSDLYGGTWSLIKGDASVYLGNGSLQTGLVEGSNIQNVPLKAHTHTINHDHGSFTANTTVSRLSSVAYGNASGTSSSVPTSGWSGFVRTGDGTGYGLRFHNTQYNQASTINIPNTSGLVSGSEGEAFPTMDVSGAKLKINVWQKTAS